MTRDSTLDLTVTRHEGPRFWVDLDGREIPCILRGRLKQGRERVSSVLVVGDRVTVALHGEAEGSIEVIHPRRSELVRPGFAGLAHVIAANLDHLVIVQAAAQPPFKRRLVERFIATASRGGMAAVVVVNKCDLVAEAEIRSWLEPLRDSGVPVILTSAETGTGIAELRALLERRTSALAGQSGVGKSSLVNAMYPELGARTSQVSERLNKGRHTTTASRLYRLPGGGYLADTPGIRTLGLFEDEEAVDDVFPEIVAAAGGCRFRDCSHSRETGCAVRDAVERGAIDGDRYRNYLRLHQGR